MIEGLMIYDDDAEASLTERLARAVACYHQKYDSLPGVCYVHPAVTASNGDVEKIGDVRVAPLSTVLRHHFWVCPEEGEGRSGIGHAL